MEEKTISSFDGTNIFYKIVRQKGPFLVLLHGGSGSNHSWLFQEPELVKQGYSLIIPDMRGHGRSSRGKSLDFFEVENCCQDIKIILKEEKIEKATVIGHSLGGQIAQKFYTQYSENVDSLILISSKIVESRSKIWSKLMNWVFYFVFYLPFYGKSNSNYPDYNKFTQTADLNPVRIISDIRCCSLKTYAATLIVGNNLENPDYRSIKVPTLVLHGKEDLILPHNIMEKISSEMTNFSFVSLSTNHITLLNRPAEINQKMLSFLSKIYPT